MSEPRTLTAEDVAAALATYRRRSLAVAGTAVLPLRSGERMPVVYVDRRHRTDIGRVLRAERAGSLDTPADVDVRLLASGDQDGTSLLVLDVALAAPAAWRFALVLELPRLASLVAAIVDLGGLIIVLPDARTADRAIRDGVTLPLDARALGQLLARGAVWRG